MPVTPGPSPEYGIDSLMPIYPNTRFAKGQSGCITPETPFPFDTCFFQRNGDISLRLRPNDIGFNAAHGIKMDRTENKKLRRWREQETLVQDNEQASSGTLQAHDEPVSHSGSRPFPSSHSLDTPVPLNASGSRQGRSVVFDGSDSSNDSDLHPNDILLLNPFGWDRDTRIERLPLVDGWIELEEHLTSDTIPDPRGLYEECDEIRS